MKIVIVGAGKVGSEIARALSGENHNVVIVDSKRECVESLTQELDVLGLVGNGVVEDDLIEAGVKGADVVMAVTKSDETNVICCLVAKKLGARRTVARVREPEYSAQTEFMRSSLGIDLVVNPDKETADEIARLLRYPGAEHVDTLGHGKADIVGLRLEADCDIVGKSLRELFRTMKIKVLVCAVERDGEVIIPDGDNVFAEGDVVYFSGNYRSVDALLRQLELSVFVRSVLIVGGSRISHYLASLLIDSGIKVKIIERNRIKCERLAEALPKALVVCGDGTDKNVLAEEGIDLVDSVITLTGGDEENILLSLYAKSRGVDKVITKVNGTTFSNLLATLDLGSVISPKSVASETLVRYTRSLQAPEGSNVLALYRIVGDKAEVVMFTANEGSKILGKPLKELRFRKGSLIAGVLRGREFIAPDGNTVIEAGDEVLVVSAKHKFYMLDDVLN